MENLSLPLKTKIAAWIMIIKGSTGILTSIISIILIFRVLAKGALSPETTLGGGVLLLLAAFYFNSGLLFLFLPGLLLLVKKKKWTWYYAIFSLLLLLSAFNLFVLGNILSAEKILKLPFFREDPSLILVFIVEFFRSYLNIPLFFLFGDLYLIISLFLLLLDRKNFWKLAK